MSDVVRVPALQPLSPAMLTACALLADGWSYHEAARLMGVEYGTLMSHVNVAASRLPGDLPARAKCVAWYRGASAEVLGVDAVVPSRQESLHKAYTIYGGRACPHCGNLLPHGKGQPLPGGDD